MAAGTSVAGVVSTTASREDAAKVLPEADARFFRYAGGVGIDSLEEILDFLLNLPVDDTDVRIARWGYLPWLDLLLDLVLLDPVWLDLVLHFRLHPHAISEAATRIVPVNTWARDKFRFGEEQPNISGIDVSVNGTLVVSGFFGKVRQSLADTAWGDGSKKQFSVESVVGEVGGDEISYLVSGGAGIEENDDRRTGTAEGHAEDARLPNQLL